MLITKSINLLLGLDMILPPKDILDILVNLKECIDSQLLFDPNGDWRGEFLAQVFGASSYELSYENRRIDFKDFSISPKSKIQGNPPGYDTREAYKLYFMKQVGPEVPNRFFVISFQAINGLSKQNPLTKENITSTLNVEWTGKKFDLNLDYITGICKDNQSIKEICISMPNNLNFLEKKYIDSLSIALRS